MNTSKLKMGVEEAKTAAPFIERALEKQQMTEVLTIL